MSLKRPDIDARTLRAAKEHMTVIEEGDALFEVTSQSGRAYMVDLREPACECPDFTYRDGVKECKHIRRVGIETGQIDVDALENSFIERANQIRKKAEELQRAVVDLEEAVAELEGAVDRLREVAER